MKAFYTSSYLISIAFIQYKMIILRDPPVQENLDKCIEYVGNNKILYESINQFRNYEFYIFFAQLIALLFWIMQC